MEWLKIYSFHWRSDRNKSKASSSEITVVSTAFGSGFTFPSSLTWVKPWAWLSCVSFFPELSWFTRLLEVRSSMDSNPPNLKYILLLFHFRLNNTALYPENQNFMKIPIANLSILIYGSKCGVQAEFRTFHFHVFHHECSLHGKHGYHVYNDPMLSTWDDVHISLCSTLSEMMTLTQGEEQTVQLAHGIFLMVPLFFFPLKDCGRVLWNYNSTLVENISELKKIKLGSHVAYMPVFCVVVFSFPLYVRDMRKALERGFALGIDTKLPWVRATATRLQVHRQLTWSPRHVLLTTS